MRNAKQMDLEDRTLIFAKNMRSVGLMNIFDAILRRSE